MPSPVPFAAAQTSSGVTAVSYAVAITTPSPAGNMVTVCASSSDSISASGVTDTQGNTYVQSAHTSSDMWASMWTCAGAAALGTSDTVTVTFNSATSGQKNFIVLSGSGVSAVDQGHGSHGSSTSPSTTTAALGQGLELAVMTVSCANAGGLPAAALGWTAIANTHSGSNQYMRVFYQVQYTSAAVTGSAVITSAAWSDLVVTYEMPLYPVPAVPVFVAGLDPEDPDMTGWITDSFGFCTQGVMFRGYQAFFQGLSGSGFTTIQYDTILEDPYSGWNASDNQWTAPFSGWYEATCTCNIAAASSQLNVGFVITTISGSVRYELQEMLTPSGNSGGACASGIFYLTGGEDTIQAVAEPTGAGSPSTDAGTLGTSPAMEISFISQ